PGRLLHVPAARDPGPLEVAEDAHVRVHHAATPLRIAEPEPAADGVEVEGADAPSRERGLAVHLDRPARERPRELLHLGRGLAELHLAVEVVEAVGEPPEAQAPALDVEGP